MKKSPKSCPTKARKGGGNVGIAAILTIFDASRMTAVGRRSIAAWLLKQAFYLVAYGQEYAQTYTGRYRYRD